MASLITTSSYLCSNSSPFRNSAVYPVSSSLISCHNKPRFFVPRLGSCPFSQWNGLKPQPSISRIPKSLKKDDEERRGRCNGTTVKASLFGVGAPEALVIGVVALLVFGPKGLAEVARNLGKTLRAFQPTIRELQEVSREFKSTLEREVGLDDISNQTQNVYSSSRINTASPPSSVGSAENSPTVADPNGVASPTKAYTSEDYLKFTEEQLKAAASQQQRQTPVPEQSQFEPQFQPQATIKENDGAMPSPQKLENDSIG